jgi:membrane protease YdiL (CAAX protease family)
MIVSESKGWWRPDAWPPALLIVAPFFINKLIYASWPSYPVFLITDYICHMLGLGLVYLLLRNSSTPLPIPFRLTVPSRKQLAIALSTILVLIGVNVIVLTPFRYLDAHAWRLTRFPAPTNIVVQSFDVTVGTALAGLSEEVVFRFYLINLFLLRRRSPAMAVLLSTLIFAVIHWSYGPGITIFAALAGLIFASLYTRRATWLCQSSPMLASTRWSSPGASARSGAFTVTLRSALSARGIKGTGSRRASSLPSSCDALATTACCPWPAKKRSTTGPRRATETISP